MRLDEFYNKLIHYKNYDKIKMQSICSCGGVISLDQSRKQHVLYQKLQAATN